LIVIEIACCNRSRLRQAQAAVGVPRTRRDESISKIHDVYDDVIQNHIQRNSGRSQAFDKRTSENEVYYELDEAKIHTPNQKDNKPESTDNGYEGLHQPRMSVGNAEYLTPIVSDRSYDLLNYATRYTPLEQVNSANSVKQKNPPNAFSGGQQQGEKKDRPLPPPPFPRIYMEVIQ
jgi:hypothetical protein